jgi:hypothetical protein
MKPFTIFKVATAIFSLSLVACVKEIGKLPKDPGFDTITFRFDNNITLKEGQVPADLSSSFGNIGRLAFEGTEIAEPVRYEFVNGEGDEHNTLFSIQGAQVKLAMQVPNVQILSIRVKATDAKSLYSMEKAIKLDVQLNANVIIPNMTMDADGYILPCSCLFSSYNGFIGGEKSPELSIENIFNFTTAGINMAQVSPEDKLKYDAWTNKSAKYYAISLEREIGSGVGGRNAKILFYNVPLEKNSMNGYKADRLNNKYVTISFASGALSTRPPLGGDFGFSTKAFQGFDMNSDSNPYKYKMYIYFFSASVKFFPNVDENKDEIVTGTLDNFRNGAGLNAERSKLLDYKTIKLTYTPNNPELGGTCN